ncbi:Gfo/Idh/MocA family oxidoreductase [Adhaeribacter swui]|uniref:Gfo/Idh/MocA family oxidoreductase n=1 Tax=Adhaeribacter swui TaxID=2086471 RepID=A0A7G7GCR6_9BACT|nr:Gfo/Idh/MocA family oxidoreductase [Adhaeribacter swui]QNF34950.1 Gfo/Idh/MocA family oxidoreductase [Adhaeribacter swui]
MSVFSSRRKFIQQLGASSLLLAGGSVHALAESEESREQRILAAEKKISANDKIRVACIGMGIMGYNDVRSALQVPGVELAAACDLYTGRLERAKELFGPDLMTTRDYREILERSDIDAVIIAPSDNWHARMTIDALNKGKAVYCEKPMVQKISEGLPVIEAQKKSGKPLQIGSQWVSGMSVQKGREYYKAGEIGQLTVVEASTDRQSALGAWQYTMPLDASPETVDWDRYIAGMGKMPYDPKKFFWWRNYRDFGTGMAGDLFVHLLSTIHTVTGSLGPNRIFASGGLTYWKDGRDVPDIMTAIMEYPQTPEHPAFEVMLRVNFVSGMGDGGTSRFVGSEGVMEIGGNSVKVSHSKMSKAPGIGGWDALQTYPQAMQQKIQEQYNQKYSAEDQSPALKTSFVYQTPNSHNMHLAHVTNFFDAVRNNKPIQEDGAFGFRAAAPSLACNDSYFEKKIINWDPVNMKIAKTGKKS